MNTGTTVKMLGRACGCIRPSSCLVAGCSFGDWDSDRVSVSLAQQPHGGRFSTSSASSSVQLPQHAVFCALVMLGFVPTAGVSVTEGGFVGAEGSVGTTMSRR